MAKRPAFSIPAGLKLELSSDSLSLEYDGDVKLEQALGRKLGDIRATGDLDITLDRITGTLVSGGTLTIKGDIDAEHLHGREVVIGTQKVTCKAITADERIVIGPGTLAVDVILAPEIAIDPKAAGRVTVIESQNERGATKIKGGFSLADYDDMFGDADNFLAQRGVKPLGESTTPAPTPALSPSRTVSPEQANTVVDDEDVEDPLSLSLDDLEPLVELSDDSASDNGTDLHDRLSDALGRITACYEGSDLPPAVEELRDLVEQRDYDALRQNITEVWNGLLGFHQKRGIRPHHQVTHAFNVIHGLVQT